MAKEVNVYFEGWHATGNNVSIPQYEVDITLEWTRNDGSKGTRTETAKFPNVLGQLTLSELREWMENIVIAEMRQRLEVDA